MFLHLVDVIVRSILAVVVSFGLEQSATWVQTRFEGPAVGPYEQVEDGGFDIVLRGFHCPSKSGSLPRPRRDQLCAAHFKVANRGREATLFAPEVVLFVGGDRFESFDQQGDLFELTLSPDTLDYGVALFEVPRRSAATKMTIDADRDGEAVTIERLLTARPP